MSVRISPRNCTFDELEKDRILENDRNPFIRIKLLKIIDNRMKREERQCEKIFHFMDEVKFE